MSEPHERRGIAETKHLRANRPLNSDYEYLMPVPFIDLNQQYLGLRDEVLSAVDRVFHSTQFVLGKETAAFEEEFAAYCGAQYGIAVNSGTSALHLALLAGGVGPGDEVITVPFTFVAARPAI